MSLVAIAADQMQTREDLCDAFEMLEPGKPGRVDRIRMDLFTRHRKQMMREEASKRKRQNAQCAIAVPNGIGDVPFCF